MSTWSVKSLFLVFNKKFTSPFLADFASLVWSPASDKIAYVAEQKVPKSDPYLPLKKKSDDATKDKEPQVNTNFSMLYKILNPQKIGPVEHLPSGLG